MEDTLLGSSVWLRKQVGVLPEATQQQVTALESPEDRLTEDPITLLFGEQRV